MSPPFLHSSVGDREGEIPLRASNIYELLSSMAEREEKKENRARPSRRCRRGFRPVATNSRIKRGEVDDNRRGETREQAGK